MTSSKQNLTHNTTTNSQSIDPCSGNGEQEHGPTRRDALKTVAATVAAGAAGLTSSFATAAAMLDGPYPAHRHRPIDKRHWVAGHEGVLVFVDDWDGVPNRQMRAVSLLNTASQPVTLDRVNPGLLRADSQVFDLNHIVAKGPIVLMPQQTRSFGLFPVDASAIEPLLPARGDTVGTLIHATPHSISADGWQSTTQYAVIA